MITWVYADSGFSPSAKIQNGAKFSIINDYLGTPIQAYNEIGEKIWERELSIYGETRIEKGFENFIPFTYQGQYFDSEIKLCYNRFRYYDVKLGLYLSKDPIDIEGGLNVYSYVPNSNIYLDVFGLSGERWLGKTTKDGTPYKKPAPKSKGTGDHNAKIDEIIKRESAKPGIEHIGGGSKTEIILDDLGGHKDFRRMDASFRKPDGSKYHINVGRTLEDGKTGVIRERLAMDDVQNKGHIATFEGYGKASKYK